MTSGNRAPLQQRATSSLAALALCAAALMSNAQAAPCPASNFDDFFKTLQDRPKIRMNHVRKPLTLQWVEMQGDQPRVKKSAASDPGRELLHDQDAVKAAFKAGSFTTDTIVVVRFQGPRANGMPELHGLTPALSVLQDRGLRVALVTDGRMSGASGKVPAAIHISPEAAMGGPLARLRDGDLVRLDATAGTLDVLTQDFTDRPAVQIDLTGNSHGMGRELFELFRQNVGPSSDGARTLI